VVAGDDADKGDSRKPRLKGTIKTKDKKKPGKRKPKGKKKQHLAE